MKQLVAKVAALLGVSEAQARICVDAVTLAISERKRCRVTGLGTFTRTESGELRFRAKRCRG